MIKSITITNHLNESITMELSNPEKSGFIIQSIDGLGPAKGNINITEMATSDGGVFNSARLETRNIVLNLLFMEKPTIEAVRLLSYKYFPIKRTITFAITTDTRVCKIVGTVESNEPDIFKNQEGCQISILCPDPFFYLTGENEDTKTTFYGTVPLFEFPFENNEVGQPITFIGGTNPDTNHIVQSLPTEGIANHHYFVEEPGTSFLTEYQYINQTFHLIGRSEGINPAIEFGRIENRTEGTVYYDGDSEVGITMIIHATGTVTGLAIYNLDTREVMRISDEKLIELTGAGIQAGDTITITTTRGSKGIILLRGGREINILNTLENPIGWFKLHKGDNLFTYVASFGITNLQFRIENKTLFEGV